MKNYEVGLMARIKNINCNDDFETMHYECADNYRQAVKIAKEFSKHIGEENVGNYNFSEDERYHGGLANVYIVCYTENDATNYHELWHEFYANGEKVDRVVWE